MNWLKALSRKQALNWDQQLALTEVPQLAMKLDTRSRPSSSLGAKEVGNVWWTYVQVEELALVSVLRLDRGRLPAEGAQSSVSLDRSYAVLWSARHSMRAESPRCFHHFLLYSLLR